MAKPRNSYLRRFNRWLIWPLVVLLAIYIVSGYGIINPGLISALTGELLTRNISLYLHLNLAFPVMILITIHVLIGIESALISWGVKEGKLLYAFMIALGVFAVVLLVLMQYFLI